MKSICDQMTEIQNKHPHYLDKALLSSIKLNKDKEITKKILENIKLIDSDFNTISISFESKIFDSLNLFVAVKRCINPNILNEITFTPIALHLLSSLNYFIKQNPNIINSQDIKFLEKINPKKELSLMYTKEIGPDYRQKFNKEFEAEHFDLAKQVNPKIKRAS